MKQQKEGSGETKLPPSGAQIMKVKQEIGEEMKKAGKSKKSKEKARDSIAQRVAKRSKKDGGSDKESSSGPHAPSSLKTQDVVSLMVQAEAPKELGRACLPDETPETAPTGWFCVHENYISKCHLRFPLPDLLLDLLDHYQLALSQLCPSVIRVINGFITRAKEEGISVELHDLMSIHSIKESSSSKGGSGTYYLPSRPGLGVFKFSASDDDWRKKYFYVKVDPLTVPPGRVLRVSWTDASDIEDPDKLSGKLTRALSRKLKQSPSTWGAYTTSRIGSARFPERYKASFLDPVPVIRLEVSEGDSIVSVSTRASTSETERTQSKKMPLQPSFRRTRQAKAASTSRGSEKNQGGSFLSSVKEVLDDGNSQQAKDVIPPGAQKSQDMVPPQAAETDLQVVAEPPEIEPPKSKRSRTDQMDRPSRSSSSSSRGGTVGWSFTHSKPGSILDDSWGLATLMRHMKTTGCSLPVIGHLTNKEEYAEIAHYMGQLAGAINRAQLKFEDTVNNAPDAGELAQVTELVKATKAERDRARAQVSTLQAEVERLGLKADTQQGKIESMTIDLRVKNRRISELEAARKVAEQQVQELITSSQVSQKNKEAEVRLAIRKGKKEVADAYNKILISVKDKFAKKKEEVSLQIYVQELQANADLLKEMLANEIESADEEYNRLMTLIPGALAAYEKAQVSDFSVSRLPLPQISDSSGIFEINLFNPSFSGEYGSNLSSMDPDSAPTETTIGGSDKEVGDGVPAKEKDPGEEGQDAEKVRGEEEG